MHAVEDRPDVELDLLIRVYGEYMEMPGLVLTLAQASRLWNVDREQAAQVLESMVDSAFLRRIGAGYVRADSCRVGV